MKKSRCSYCGAKFISRAEKLRHRKKYPNKSCSNIEDKGGNNKMLGIGKKKEKEVAVEAPVDPPQEDIVLPEEPEEEVDDEIDEEKTQEKPKQDKELTTSEITGILAAHDEAIKRILYHLRI